MRGVVFNFTFLVSFDEKASQWMDYNRVYRHKLAVVSFGDYMQFPVVAAMWPVGILIHTIRALYSLAGMVVNLGLVAIAVLCVALWQCVRPAQRVMDSGEGHIVDKAALQRCVDESSGDIVNTCGLFKELLSIVRVLPKAESDRVMKVVESAITLFTRPGLLTEEVTADNYQFKTELRNSRSASAQDDAATRARHVHLVAPDEVREAVDTMALALVVIMGRKGWLGQYPTVLNGSASPDAQVYAALSLIYEDVDICLSM